MWGYVLAYFAGAVSLYAVGAVGAWVSYRRQARQRLTITGVSW